MMAHFLDSLGDIELLRAEAHRIQGDRDRIARLLYLVYMAGTEQTQQTFQGVEVGFVEDVLAHVRKLKAAAVKVADREAVYRECREAFSDFKTHDDWWGNDEDRDLGMMLRVVLAVVLGEERP